MRILIVEDEIKIREGMGKLIESQTDHIVIGEAANGEEGLSMVLRFKPDLVITDIRMPKMDGLEMLRQLYEEKVPVHAIILSGYSEFEYAKKGIQYGVDDYLLKPLAVEDVKEMLEKIERKIAKEQLTSGTPELYLRDLILSDQGDMEKKCEILRKVTDLSSVGNYELIEGYIGAADASYRDKLDRFMEEQKENTYLLSIYSAFIDNLQKVYILVYDKENTGKRVDFEKSFYNKLISLYKNKQEKPVWIKKEFKEINQLKETALELDHFMSYALVIEPDGWMTSEKIAAYNARPYVVPMELNNRIRSAICQEDVDKLRCAACDFMKYLAEGQFEPEDIRRAMVKNYYFISDILQDMDASLYNHMKNENFIRNINAAVTWGELQRAYDDVIFVITGNKRKREDISNYVIKKAINYIREHYQEGITLEEVSRELDITPEYLSTLFNREMEINFSLFLKKFRISHAKRLLKGTDMKIYEIANATGYSDPKYFQRVFKEEIGVSPGEYRQMNLGGK